MRIKNDEFYTLMTYDIDGNDSNANKFVKECLMGDHLGEEVIKGNMPVPRVWSNCMKVGRIEKPLPESTLVASGLSDGACEQFEEACKVYGKDTTGKVCCVEFMRDGCKIKKI